MSATLAGTPEAIAFELLRAIARQEDKLSGDNLVADRQWLLENYRDCLRVAKGGLLKERRQPMATDLY